MDHYLTVCVAIVDDADESGDVVVVEGGEEAALAREVIPCRLARPSFRWPDLGDLRSDFAWFG